MLSFLLQGVWRASGKREGGVCSNLAMGQSECIFLLFLSTNVFGLHVTSNCGFHVQEKDHGLVAQQRP